MKEQAPSLVPIKFMAAQDLPEGISQDDAIRQGLAGFEKGSEVPLVYNDGSKIAIDARTAVDDIKSGLARLYTEEEQTNAINEKLYGDRELTAAALGAARTLTFGGSDVLASAIGQEEFVKGVQEANPIASTLGEVGGAFVPLLGQAGATALAARGAVKTGAAVAKATGILGAPIRAVTKVANGADTAVGKIISGDLGRIAGGAAAGAIEGAIGGAGYSVGQAALNNADTLSEYANAAFSGATVGTMFGSLIGGGIPTVGVAARAGNKVLNSAIDKTKNFTKEVLKKEDQARGVLSKDDSVITALNIADGEIKVRKEMADIPEISNEFGVNSYASQIDADGKFRSGEQRLLRTDSELAEQLKNQLREDAEKVGQTVSSTIGEETAVLRSASESESGKIAEEGLVKYVDDLIKPFREPYENIKKRAENLKIDTADFYNMFDKWSRQEDQVTRGFIASENPKVANFSRNLLAQKNLKGVLTVQQQVRAASRNKLESTDLDKKSLDMLDEYITDYWNNLARPLDEAAIVELKNIRNDINNLDKKYAIMKTQDMAIIDDIVKLPPYAKTNAFSLYDYLTSPGTLTETDFVKKIKDKDPATLRALEKIPVVKEIAKARQVSDFMQKIQGGSKNAGRVFANGSEYVDFIALNKQYNTLSKEQKNFLFSPEQQKTIQNGIKWVMSFEHAGSRATPYRYLTEPMRSSLVKSQEEAGAAIAGAIAGMGVTGSPLLSIGAAIASSIASKAGRKAWSNITEARDLRKIRGMVDTSTEELARGAGVVGAVRKAEAKVGKKIKESVNSLFEKFEENRGKVIQGTKGMIYGPDTTTERLKKEYTEVSASLNEIRGNEEGYLDTVMDSLQDVSDIDGDLAASMASQQYKTAQFLLAKMPQNPFGDSTSPIAKSWMPDDSELRKFMSVQEAAINPMSVVENVKNGTVSPDEIEVLQTLFPKIYEQMAAEVKQKAEASKVAANEEQKAVMAIVLGGNYDETFAPSFTNILGAQQQQPQQQNAPSGQPNGSSTVRVSALNKAKFNDRQQTQTERVMGRS